MATDDAREVENPLMDLLHMACDEKKAAHLTWREVDELLRTLTENDAAYARLREERDALVQQAEWLAEQLVNVPIRSRAEFLGRGRHIWLMDAVDADKTKVRRIAPETVDQHRRAALSHDTTPETHLLGGFGASAEYA